MSTLLIYLFESVACSALFMLFYRVVLHRRRAFPVSRAFLFLSLAAAMAIPALDIPVWPARYVEQMVSTPEVSLAQTAPVAPTLRAETDTGAVLMWTIYSAGVAILLRAAGRQWAKIARIRRRAAIHSCKGWRVAVSDEIEAPFSLLDTIYLPRNVPHEEMRWVVMHEASHVRHRHSFEKIAMVGVKIVLWFNPFAWWASRLLDEVHEFEADADVLAGGCGVREYLGVIFRQRFGVAPDISVGLDNSLTKKRFEMMKNIGKQTKGGWLRATGVLPLAAVTLVLFGFTRRAPEIVVARGGATQIEQRAQTASGEEFPVPTAPKNSAKSDDEPVYIAEETAKFQGGDLNHFRKWVQERIIYPKDAFGGKIAGKVTVKYIVERDGSVSNIEVVASPHKSLSDEVVRVISASPLWTPAKQKGKTVRMVYILPVDFVILSDGEAAPAAGKGVNEGEQVISMGDIAVVGYRESNPLTPAEYREIGREVAGGAGSLTDGDLEAIGRRVEARAHGHKAARVAVFGKDGKPVDAGNPFIWLVREKRSLGNFEKIDPGTIESLSVLKDGNVDMLSDEVKVAMAGGDYNGVILVTTKK